MILNPLISILLPVYNAEKHIKKALNSITNQTYKNLEIICIDDGSSDNSLQIIENLAKDDQRLKVYKNEQNLGLIRTLNKAIDLTKGEYIARMDADDVSLPERLEKQLNFLKRNNLDMVDCQIEYTNEKGHIFKRNSFVPSTQKALLFYSFFKTPLLHPTILCKSKILKENIYIFDKSIIHCEDYQLWTRLLQKKYSIKKMSEKLYIQLVNADSVSNKFEHIQKQNIKFYFNAYITRKL